MVELLVAHRLRLGDVKSVVGGEAYQAATGATRPETGVAPIMPYELFDVYDKTGPGFSNYKQ